ncbi:hypothetical protein ABPG73_001048 [Tetrahymena malaccensis]
MENNYIEETNSHENSNPQISKHDYEANQINSTKINSSIQQNIYTIKEDSQENNQNQASKNNLSKFNTPKNKSQVHQIHNEIQNCQYSSNQLQKTNTKLFLQNKQNENLDNKNQQSSNNPEYNKDENQINQSSSQIKQISNGKKENIQHETGQQKQSTKQDDLIQEQVQQQTSCLYQQQQQQQQTLEIEHKQNEIELLFKKKSSSNRMKKQNKDLILDNFIFEKSKIQKQENGENILVEQKKNVLVQKEENILIKKQNLHENLIQINQYFDGMKFNFQKSFTFKADEKENYKLNQNKVSPNQQNYKGIIDNEKQAQSSSQLPKKSVFNQNLNGIIVEEKKENINKMEQANKNILSVGSKDLNIQFPQLFFEKNQKNKQKRMPIEDNNNYFSQINMRVQINQDQINEKAKSQTFKDKPSQNEFNISKNLSFDNIFNEKTKRPEISFNFQNEFQNLSSDQKCLQINNFDLRNKKIIKILNEYQDQFNSLNYQLDSILQKSIEQKWEAQYLQEEKNNITKDIYDIAQTIKKLI